MSRFPLGQVVATPGALETIEPTITNAMRVCPKCKHLIDDEPHKCPTPEYLAARNRLVSAAAEAEDRIPSDKLEEATRGQTWD